MHRAAVPELSRDTAGVLARVQAGEPLEITSEGRPIARLLPIESQSHPLPSLISSGLLRPAR